MQARRGLRHAVLGEQCVQRLDEVQIDVVHPRIITYERTTYEGCTGVNRLRFLTSNSLDDMKEVAVDIRICPPRDSRHRDAGGRGAGATKDGL
ncbi:hypothetical protein GCM10010307_19650 [Streptomyces vastus]|uniref:Uncharacterized protein n=1 Tax=Streptomyces vastus TaxID=285451 RepID=A0ABP6CYA7_9ACTN